MVKVIHDNRRFVERPVHGIVIAQIRQPPFFRHLPYCGVQFFPVAAAAFLVNFLIEGSQAGVAFSDVLQNYEFVAAPQIKVFQPNQVAFVFDLLNNRRNIRNARKNGGDEAGGADSCLMEGLHGGQPPRDANRHVHICLKALVKRVDGPGNAGMGKCFYQIQVPQHQIGFCSYADFRPAVLKLFQERPCSLVDFFLGAVRVGHGTDKQLFSRVFPGVAYFRPVFDVQKGSPWFRMTGEPFHERGVAVFTGVGAAHVRIDRVIGHRQI